MCVDVLAAAPLDRHSRDPCLYASINAKPSHIIDKIMVHNVICSALASAALALDAARLFHILFLCAHSKTLYSQLGASLSVYAQRGFTSKL